MFFRDDLRDRTPPIAIHTKYQQIKINSYYLELKYNYRSDNIQKRKKAGVRYSLDSKWQVGSFRTVTKSADFGFIPDNSTT